MKWTHYEIKLLKEKYPAKTDLELEKIFKRKRATIRRQASTLGIKKLYRSPKIEWQPTLSKDLFYILGVLEGDGYIEKNTPYKIALGATDKPFIEEFYLHLTKIGLVPSKKSVYIEYPKYRFGSFLGKKPLFRLRVYSKAFTTWYFNTVSYEWIEGFKTNKEYMFYFIKGVYESDGCFLRKDWRIRIACTNKELLEILKKILEYYNYNPTLSPDGYIRGRNKPYYQFNLNRKKEVISFLNEIKPCIARRAL